MGALADLGQLLRVAEQQQVARGRGHRDGVGQVELAGLLEHQQVEALPWHSRFVREIPCGTTDHAAGMVGDERGVVVLVDLGPPRVGALAFLGHPRRVHPGVEHLIQQMLDHRM